MTKPKRKWRLKVGVVVVTGAMAAATVNYPIPTSAGDEAKGLIPTDVRAQVPERVSPITIVASTSTRPTY